MKTKVLEIRDRGTCIRALAIRMQGTNPFEEQIIARCGYPARGDQVILTCLDDGRGRNDPYEWGQARTLPVAHMELIEHWESWKDGDVLDVRVILGEATEPAPAEVFVPMTDQRGPRNLPFESRMAIVSVGGTTLEPGNAWLCKSVADVKEILSLNIRGNHVEIFKVADDYLFADPMNPIGRPPFVYVLEIGECGGLKADQIAAFMKWTTENKGTIYGYHLPASWEKGSDTRTFVPGGPL